jgi:hypothetical protein
VIKVNSVKFCDLAKIMQSQPTLQFANSGIQKIIIPEQASGPYLTKPERETEEPFLSSQF